MSGFFRFSSSKILTGKYGFSSHCLRRFFLKFFPLSSGCRFFFFISILLFANIACSSKSNPEADKQGEKNDAGFSLLEKVEIGGVDQWLLARGASKDKPVLLVLHGGPGAGSIGFARYFYEELERDFIVVNWDQRGAGKSFSFFFPDVTPETYVSDTIEVVRFLKKRFGVRKIYLMGHSWGGYIGAIASYRIPSDLYAFIAVGPVVDGEQSARRSFEYLKRQPSESPEVSSELKDLTFEEYMKDRRKWLNLFGLGMFHGKHRADEDRFLGGIMYESPDYSTWNILTYLPGIWRSSSRIRPYFFEMNLFKQAPSAFIPSFYFSGKFDYYNPEEILLKYFARLDAKEKTFESFDCCAHAPHFESPHEFAARMKLIKSSTYK
ncbi:alpha/beta hydrolase [Leptospira fluminis]|uniref:Alpha/beta hydrolase n=1 Tax=Leptospira fluminis TaxID=2484979 RepID=A0A4R9GP90_9LEPT|nr:alpha/beta hydrolase [Leptospira fluminis]